MLKLLEGRKTYLVAALGVVWVIVGVCFKWLEVNTAVELLLGFLGLAALRAGVAKGTDGDSSDSSDTTGLPA